ncbi:hypothetical protein B0H12DRAFT_837236 [Mycena haematopus]|nr:hypothetical protein B0H12DRAFT_837236 [Mycena haematopus]
MSTFAVPRSASTGTNPLLVSPGPLSPSMSDVEPDEAWKENRRQEIKISFQPMIQEAKDRLEGKLQASTLDRDSPEYAAQKEVFFNEYEEEENSIRRLAKEEFANSLANERVFRVMTLPGISVNPTVKKSVEDEQEAIYAQIQKRRGSTTSSVTQASISPKSSESPVAVHETPQTAPDSRSSQNKSSKPTILRAPGSSNINVPVREPPPTRSSRETSKPPANEALFGSIGQTSASSAAQERKMSRSGSGASPVPASAPIDNRRMSTSPTAPSQSSSYRAPTLPSGSPAPTSARHEPSPHPSVAPLQGRTTQAPGPSPSNPHPPAARTLDRKTSQTWKDATSTQISSLSAKHSQSNFHNMSSSPGTKAEVWVSTILTEEPEEESFGRSVPLQSERSRDPASEKPLAPRQHHDLPKSGLPPLHRRKMLRVPGPTVIETVRVGGRPHPMRGSLYPRS